MILSAFRKFWWIPLLVVAAGYFLLPGKSAKNRSEEYVVSSRFRTRPAFAAECRKTVDHFCDSSDCLPKGIIVQTISTREDEYIYIDLRISSTDSSLLVKALPAIDGCIRKDKGIYALVFSNSDEINRLMRSAKNLLREVPHSDSLNHFLLEKNLFDLRERDRDIRDIFLYTEATPDLIVRSQSATGGSIFKRMVILTIIGLFLMILVAEVSRRRNSQHD